MIYFVESIPGGGKSYYSRKIDRKAEKRTIYYKEEYYNPLDLLRQAVLTNEEYKHFLSDVNGKCCNENEYLLIKARIEAVLTSLDDRVFIPFLHIDTSNESVNALLMNLYSYEYDDGFVPYTDYCETILKRLECFLHSCDPSVDYIFEGALLHNPLFTILGFYDLTDSEIIKFYECIYSLLSSYEYEIHLIEVDNIKKAIVATAHNRMMAGNLTWENGFDKWFIQTKNYSNLNGIDGIVAFSKDIINYEKMIIDTVPFKNKIIERRI